MINKYLSSPVRLYVGYVTMIMSFVITIATEHHLDENGNSKTMRKVATRIRLCAQSDQSPLGVLWVAKDPNFLDSGQTAWMHRLI